MSGRRDQKATLSHVTITAKGPALHGFGDFGRCFRDVSVCMAHTVVVLGNEGSGHRVTEDKLFLTLVQWFVMKNIVTVVFVFQWWYLVVVGRVLNATAVGVAFWFPLFWVDVCMYAAGRTLGWPADVRSGKATVTYVATSGTIEVLSSSWTPSLSGRVVVRLRERRQGTVTCCGGLVGLHNSLALLVVVERQLDLTSVIARLRGCNVCWLWFYPSSGIVVFVFQWWYLVVVGGEVEVLRLGDQLLRWCAREAYGLGFTVFGQTSSVVLVLLSLLLSAICVN
ncbi:hypothetical protein Taro_029046 [Colocasia esculenta]|uniref:Transmembrane protein n=1 Tax=Colocasia esculenta TaxID=4460 RepID=A0A843VIU7_COLES|nr:hypothetical protein [Colocasia esculenta]